MDGAEYSKTIKNENETYNMYDVVIVALEEDLHIIEKFIDIFAMYLPMKRLVIIGNSKVKEHIKNIRYQELCYIDEESLVSCEKIRNIISKRTQNNINAVNRSGWYLQQFLKMKYATICQDDYYLLWDCDTIPLKKVTMFSDKPIFDIKEEYHKAYFDTIGKILPGYEKKIPKSFISEHMLIHSKSMNKLIANIEANTEIEGQSFDEKILNAISKDILPFSGFSEFETYGTYMLTNYSNFYNCREWKSLREGAEYFDIKKITMKDFLWLSKDYDAITFEKNKNKRKGYLLMHNSFLQKILPFSKAKKIIGLLSKLERGTSLIHDS